MAFNLLIDKNSWQLSLAKCESIKWVKFEFREFSLDKIKNSRQGYNKLIGLPILTAHAAL